MRPLRRPSHATLVAYLALFVALGGSSYAAVQLGRGSVKAKHIARNAVNSSKVKDRSLSARDFARGQLPAGAQGPQGPAGDKGATGAKGETGDQGQRGLQGEPGPFPGELPSGKTIRGAYDIEGDARAANGIASHSISFGFTLDSAPTPHTIPAVQGPSTECPGSVSSPEAAPGHLCIYERASTNKSTSGPLYPQTIDPEANDEGEAGRFGAGLYVVSAADGHFYSIGTWAVTSP